MKAKHWEIADFRKRVEGREWVRLKGAKEILPADLQGIPDAILELACVSGTLTPADGKPSPFGDGYVAGGIDVFRWDQNDLEKGFPINKDHYFVIAVPDRDDDQLIVWGPTRDDEHWLESIPEHYETAVIYFDTDGNDEPSK